MNKEDEPKKSLGQHWLNDEASLRAIVAAGEVDEDDVVLEVGPGPGALTKLLVEQAKQVVAVEFDEALAKNLPSKVKADNLEVVQADILSFDLGKLPASYKVVANIPYYLTSHLVRRLHESDNSPATSVLLVQKEVAERIAAQPGSMSLLSVAAQFFTDVSLGGVVPAELFTPPPKVDSQVVIMQRKPELPNVDQRRFFRVVKAGFGERRKKIANSLSGGLGLAKSEVGDALAGLGYSENIRAQELSLDQWLDLFRALDATLDSK